MCVPTLEAINYIHMILNLYNKLSKFVTFQHVMKQICPWVRNEAHHENQPNKSILSEISYALPQNQKSFHLQHSNFLVDLPETDVFQV